MVCRPPSKGARSSCATANSMPPLMEVRSANDAGQLQKLIAEFAGRDRAVDNGPVDHQLLCPESRPFHKTHRDALMGAVLDGVEHLRIRDRGGVTFALEQEFWVINAA